MMVADHLGRIRLLYVTQIRQMLTARFLAEERLKRMDASITGLEG